jgi:hypothetical protein
MGQSYMTNQRTNWAVWASVATVLVFAAAFMPWGVIRGTPSASSFNGPAGEFFGSNPFGGMTVTLTVTGWNGTVTLAGISLPNWTVVLLAAAVTALAWLVVTDAWQPPRYLGPALAVLGLLQVLLTLLVLAGSEKSSLGIGILATAVGLGILTFTSFSLAKARPLAAQ